MEKTNENPGIVPTLPHSVSGGAEKEKGPWNEKTMLNLLTEALGKVCGPEAGDCDLGVRGNIAYLRGSVANLAQKRALAKAALAVPGVRAIVNHLRIAPLMPRSDQQIAADVRAALAVVGLPLEVRVLDGVVYLSGTVGSMEARGAVEDAAWSVRGMEQVVNNTTVAGLRRRGDEDLLQAIQPTLGRCLGVKSGKVRVEVHNGVVYLRGQVDSEFQKFLVEDAVRWTPYIVDVINELSVSSTRVG